MLLLSGKVTNEFNQPISNTIVKVNQKVTILTVVTDQHGKYVVSVPSKTELTIIFQCLGYQSQKINLTFKPSEKKVIDVILKDTTSQLKTVDITDSPLRSNTFVRLDPRHSSEIPGPQNSVEALIKTMAGVHSNNELSSQYSVRGGNFDENLVYINDIEIYRPFLVRSGEQEGFKLY